MAVTATWSPGREARASMQFVGLIHHQAALVLSLDPDVLVLVPPRDPSDWPRFARLLREIRDSAEELRAFLESPAHTQRGGE
ncbi:hypothetical protein DI005_14930 [Prauserella sp. PE36]|uniref:hypothetical protein n=1 Tax=Prauserella sp. PE36 TaxID=1504709 RepID=UPI000DE26A9E|nr:hypothetical protein [Prauserella sp. PE36]RBM20134.1 hypothetical protein DI005_14930 [Prauserella sp. PE36]